MMTANEARQTAIAKIEKDREQALSLADNVIEMSAKCGKFQTQINEDEMITREILRQIQEKYESLGYTCAINISQDPRYLGEYEVLTISWS